MNKKLIIKQEETSDCGVCSLLSIIRYYHGNASLEDLRISSLTSKEGVSALNLINCAIEHGFDAQGKRYESIPVDSLPCIAHVRIKKGLSHFIVIYEVKDNKVYMMDPEVGYKEMSISDFNDISTEIFILLKPKGTLKYYQPKISFNTKIKTNLFKRCKSLLLILLLNTIFLLTSIIYSYFVIHITNSYSLKNILFFLILIFVANFMTYLINNITNKLNNSISLSLLSDFLTHVFNLPLNYIHFKDSNEIIKRVLDLDSIKNINVSFIITLITNTISILVVSIILISINKILFIFILIAIIGYLLLSYIFSCKVGEETDKVIKEETEYNNYLIDYVSGLTSIKHSVNEKYFKDIIIDKYNKTNTTNNNYNKTILKVDFLKHCFISSIEFIMDVYLIRLILKGYLEYSNMIVITFLFQLISNSICLIGNHIPSLLYQKKIITKINEFYNIHEEDKRFIPIKNNRIKINNLSFSYNKYKNVINNLSINIDMNEKVIIKGESGCGKSTLCRIINKEYDNYTGNIYLGNKNYRNIDVRSVRSIIYYLSQDEVIFHGTILDNILMGRTIKEDVFNEIIEICELKRIIDKKSFGLDTYLYGGADELSGGERQLVILARSLVSNKPILILDEALSEVDDDLENRILRNMFNKYNNKTIIYVSHKNNKDYFNRTISV